RLFRPRYACHLLGVPDQFPQRRGHRGHRGDANGIARAARQPSRPGDGVDAQSALGAARADRRPRIRHRTALPGLEGPSGLGRIFFGAGRKGKLLQSLAGGATDRQTRHYLQSRHLELSIFDAFSSCEPVPTSLENATLGLSEIGWFGPRMSPKSDPMMISAIHDERLARPGHQNAALRDYDSVRRAIAFISERWRNQPTIEAMADAAAVTPDELHHLFRRWAGLTPKAFMQALTLDHAKGLLRDSASVLDAALDSGLSGPGRLHDLFVTHEAMSPGEWKNGGAGMTLRYGFHPSPFGTAIVIASGRGLAGLAFADPGEEPASFADMKRRWPNATYVEDRDGTADLAQRIFDTKMWRPDQPLRVVLIGTDFEVRVWETLLKIPMGRAVCYSDIANKISKPKASRAVGAAVGRNPVSFVVPCHRALGKGGALTGYHWGITRKQAMLGWEAGQVGVH